MLEPNKMKELCIVCGGKADLIYKHRNGLELPLCEKDKDEYEERDLE